MMSRCQGIGIMETIRTEVAPARDQPGRGRIQAGSCAGCPGGKAPHLQTNDVLDSSRIRGMPMPPLKPLHPDSSLSKAKLGRYVKQTTQELIEFLEPGQEGSLKTRPDGTIIDGHHRIRVLRDRGVDVDALPREVVTREDEGAVSP